MVYRELQESMRAVRRKPDHWFSASRAAVLALLLVALIGAVRNIGEQAARFPLLGDLGYPDSYIQYDVQHFQQTGRLYHDLSEAPYLPSLYSPLVYIWLALPGLAFHGLNPFWGPRLAALA